MIIPPRPPDYVRERPGLFERPGVAVAVATALSDWAQRDLGAAWGSPVSWMALVEQLEARLRRVGMGLVVVDITKAQETGSWRR